MRIKGIVDEDFVNYKLPCMYICTSFCDFKCDRESGQSCCQNSSVASQDIIDMQDDEIIERYISNPITHAICFAGLEPFEQFIELFAFIQRLRKNYHCDDTILIYTGFDKDEIAPQVNALREFKNIVIKFGRFVPDKESHYDETLGITLASPNQYAEVIS